MGIKETVTKVANEAAAKAIIKTLKSKYPQYLWLGTVTYDINTKRTSFTGFIKEEMDIISQTKFQ